MKKSVFEIMRKNISFKRKTCVYCGSNKLIKGIEDLSMQLKNDFKLLHKKEI